jgi:hypothetical protein
MMWPASGLWQAVRRKRISAPGVSTLRTVKRKFITTAFVLILAAVSAWGGPSANPQATSTAVPSGVSARLSAARTVFISIPPQPDRPSREPLDYAERQVYSEVFRWRLYDAVSDARSADLIFELFVTEPSVRLVVRDPTTGTEIWTFARSGKPGFLGLSLHRSFNRAVFDLLDDVRRAAGAPALLQVANSTPVASISAVPKVFISSMGQDNPRSRYSVIKPGQAYNLLYAALQSTQRFELVTAPAQSELIFEICYISPERTIEQRRSAEELFPPEDEEVDEPQVKLTVWNGATHAVLLVSTEYLGSLITKSGMDKKFAKAIQSLASKAAKSLGQSAATVSLPARVKDAPLPTQIVSAKKVFIVHPQNSVVYDELCAAIKLRGRNELVDTAADADLIIELSVDSDRLGYRNRFVFVDPKTQVVLWEVKVALSNALEQNADILMNLFHELDARAAGATPSQGK